MAWNPSPKVADCREIARKWGRQQIIIIALDPKTETIEMATYGETRALCADAERRGNAAYNTVMQTYEDDRSPFEFTRIGGKMFGRMKSDTNDAATEQHGGC